MRILHLIFRLHRAWPLRAEVKNGAYFDGKESFLEQEKRVYQPFFALLERNIQKNSRLKLSLIVSGPWLEQAEEFAPELLKRLRNLVMTDQVEVLVEPYYHSLAFFYDKNEMADQVRIAQERAVDLLGAESEFFVYPDLVYNDKIAAWAEEFGFAATIAGASGVDWRSDNHVYEAAECRYLRVLLPNRALTRQITVADPALLVEKVDKETGETRSVLSLTKFQKAAELACLRGNLLNLYFEAELLQRQREAGVIAFFDELFQNWLKTPGNQFVHASEACRVERPETEISVRETTCWRMVQDLSEAVDAGNAGGRAVEEKGLEIYYQVPKCWRKAEQIRLEKALYAARGDVLESDEAALIEDFGRLTTLDYLDTQSDRKRLEMVLNDLKKRAEAILTAPKIAEQPEEVKVSHVAKPKSSVKKAEVPVEAPVEAPVEDDVALSEHEQTISDAEADAKANIEELEALVKQMEASVAKTKLAALSEEPVPVLTKPQLKVNPQHSQSARSTQVAQSAPAAHPVKKKRRIRLVFE